MKTHRIAIYLRDGVAWVAEIEGERARTSSLVAWLSAHPGRAGARSLCELSAAARPRSPAPDADETARVRRGLIARLLGRPAAEARPRRRFAMR